MVSTSAIIAVCVTLFLTLILPILVYIAYGMRNKGKGVWTAWLLGAAGFFVMQVIIRLPIVSVLSMIPGFTLFTQRHYVLYCFILAFTAGLFEVIGRYAVAKILAKNISFTKGVAAGLGHGGIEAMVLIGMTYINNLLYIIMINSGSYDAIIEQTAALGVDTSQLIMIREALLTTSAGMFYLAGYERVLTMIFHTALSLLVCYFVWKKKDIQGIIICLVIHTLVDFVSPILSGLSTDYLGSVVSQNIAYVLIYTFLTIVAVFSVLMVRWIKKQWK